jgi:hypothetical protein
VRNLVKWWNHVSNVADHGGIPRLEVNSGHERGKLGSLSMQIPEIKTINLA